MVKSIYEIITYAGKLRKTEERIAYLREHNSAPLKNIVIATTDKNKIKFLLPAEAPPYTPSVHNENHGLLYREARKLKYFVEGWAPPGLKQVKREQVFIEMLESIHRDDAKILLQMITQKPFKGFTPEVILAAFDYTLTEKSA
ncbi:MAG: hypothetical protein COA84_12990 [Robiginitomaculum sp.]|nr:MAG: hypothetical protein COA84_12990 [Robiginitomaculum sp.]